MTGRDESDRTARDRSRGGVRVREARVSDASAIQSVARASWHEAYDEVLGRERVADTVDAWFDPERVVADDIEPPERSVFVAEAVGEDAVDVVGFAETAPGEADGVARLYRIYVAPDSQGGGVGSALLDRVEAALAERGVERLRLSVIAPNEGAIGFYEASGFDRVDEEFDDQFEVARYTYEKPVADVP